MEKPTAARERLRLPLRVEDAEYRRGREVVWHVVDRLGILVAIFSDLQTAKDVTDLLNGSGQVQNETR
jgi:hypothetical protein